MIRSNYLRFQKKKKVAMLGIEPKSQENTRIPQSNVLPLHHITHFLNEIGLFCIINEAGRLEKPTAFKMSQF
jgi:hypothetical protein